MSWIEQQDTYISFIKSFYLSFNNLKNFCHQNYLILQQNSLCIKRKNIFHQQQARNNASLTCFNAFILLSLVRNVIWRTKCSMEDYINVLKLLKVYNAIYHHYSLWTYFDFISVRMYLICAEQQKTLVQITPSLLNQNIFYQLKKEERNGKFLKSTLTVSDFSTVKRDSFRTQSSIYNKVFLWFSQRSSTIDVLPDCKYASAYTQVSLIDIICIWNILAVKYIFSDKRMKQSSSNWIKGNFISLYFILAHSYSRCVIHSQLRFEVQT